MWSGKNAGAPHNPTTKERPVLRALHPRVVDAAWTAIEPIVPEHISPVHPLGTHRRRIPDRICFTGILQRLVTGCSWDVAGRICAASESTLCRRRDEWVAAGVFDRLVEVALSAYDNEVGL